MAKRETRLGKRGKSRSHKTKARLEVKRKMLADRLLKPHKWLGN